MTFEEWYAHDESQGLVRDEMENYFRAYRAGWEECMAFVRLSHAHLLAELEMLQQYYAGRKEAG